MHRVRGCVQSEVGSRGQNHLLCPIGNPCAETLARGLIFKSLKPVIRVSSSFHSTAKTQT